MLAVAADQGYWAKVWQARHFLISLVQLDLKSRYRRSLLGIGWALMNPVLMTIVLCVVFAKMFHQDLEQHAPFVLAGIAIWGFLSASIIEGCGCIYQGEKYIRSFPLPLAIYPLRTILGLAFQFSITFSLALVVTLIFKGYPRPLVLLSVLPSMVLLFVFGWSVAVLFGVLSVYFPDTVQISQVLLQVLFYLTPVFYPSDLIQHPILHAIVHYNPLGVFVRIIRDPLVMCQLPNPKHLLFAGLAVAVTSLLALRTLSAQQKKIIFHL
jgi:lipopolysaccharide transport system permease protein